MTHITSHLQPDGSTFPPVTPDPPEPPGYVTPLKGLLEGEPEAQDGPGAETPTVEER